MQEQFGQAKERNQFYVFDTQIHISDICLHTIFPQFNYEQDHSLSISIYSLVNNHLALISANTLYT